MAIFFLQPWAQVWALGSLLCFVASSNAAITANSTITVNSTILVIARESGATLSGTSALQGYGIPYEVIDISQDGNALPTLNSSITSGNYGGIVTVSELAYEYGDDWHSALTDAQWQQLYEYQENFGVRMVRLDAWPGAEFGTEAINDSGVGVDQPVSITNASAFPTAGLVVGAGLSTAGIYHYPASITNSSVAFEIAQFAAADGYPQSTAAVINKFGNREQQVWFMPWATDWSTTSTFLSHAWIHWMTRGLYLGFRRTYFNTQIDDMFLETELYQPNGTNFRILPADMAEHITWMTDINSRMPSGSKYIIEIGHNGNGNIEAAVDNDYDNDPAKCDPQTGIEYPDQIDTPLEFQKPLGTGTSIWPEDIDEYTWELDCLQLDPLEVYWANKSNMDAFFHISHTFTHEDEDNATSSDVIKEITWNQKWLKQVGFTDGDNFSPNGIIPPAITGLHNGDAIQAWLENGIKWVVGDNTRPILMNPINSFWPLISNVSTNGYAGLYIIGRWATTIYYNCDLPDCTVAEWQATSAGKGNFSDLLDDARATNVRHLLGLHWDPYMFHQANLRVSDVPATTINGVTKRYSLLMSWVETVVTEFTRITDWPLITLKHDDIANAWIARMTRDQCYPNLSYTISADRKSITGVTVSAANTGCSAAIPVTFPGSVKSTTSATTEQVGKDPLTLWVTLDGSAKSYTLSEVISLE